MIQSGKLHTTYEKFNHFLLFQEMNLVNTLKQNFFGKQKKIKYDISEEVKSPNFLKLKLRNASFCTSNKHYDFCDF